MYKIINENKPTGELYRFDDFIEMYNDNYILPDDGEIEYIEVNGKLTNIYVIGWGGYLKLNDSDNVYAYFMTLEELKKISETNSVNIYWLGD